MKNDTLDNTIRQWSRAGILFGSQPSQQPPDLERLLLDTARHAARSARLFALVVTWLSQYDRFVARHRLKSLIKRELQVEYRPVLGFLLDLAIKHGATPTLNTAAKVCGAFDRLHPLFNIHQGSLAREQMAQANACLEAKRRGLLAPDVEIRLDTLRPASWIIQQNPQWMDRAIRKGDLRCSIIEVLRHDVPGARLSREAELLPLCAANRPAISTALSDLELEGAIVREIDSEDRRRHAIALSPQKLDSTLHASASC